MLGNYSKFLSNDKEIELEMVSHLKRRYPLFTFPLSLRQYCHYKDLKSETFAAKASFKHPQKNKYLLQEGVTYILKFLYEVRNIDNYLDSKI